MQADADIVRQEVADLISETGWGVNRKGRMCILYIIAKAKGLLTKTNNALKANCGIPRTPDPEKVLVGSTSHDMVSELHY